MAAKLTQLVNDLVSQGRFDEAHSVLQRYAAQQPDDPDIQFQLGSLCYNIGKFNDAERHFRVSLGRADASEAHYYLGLALSKLNRPAEAMSSFRESCELKGGFAAGHLQWGLALLQMGSFRGALGQFRQALKLNPSLVAAAYQAGIACYQLGQYSDAVEFFAEACEKDPGLAEAFNGLGVSLAAGNQHDKALSCFARAWQINDKLPIIKRNWAAALVHLGRLEEAARHYQEAISLGPRQLAARERALIYNDWGVNLFQQGRLDEAAEKLLLSVNVDPGLIDARLNLGIVKRSLNEYEQSADAFEKALEINPELPETNLQLGISYFLLGQYKEAVERLAQAIEKGNRNPLLDLWIGYAHLALGHFEVAERHFEKALQEYPGNFLAQDALGSCLLLQERHLEAVERFRACLQLNNAYGLAHVHLARTLESIGHSKEALLEYKTGVQKDPNCLAPDKEVIELLLNKSQWDLVLTKSRHLLELLPGDEDAQLAAARALKAQGRLEEACRVLEALSSDHPDSGPAHVLEGQIFLSQGRLLEADEKFRAASLLFEGDVALYYGWGKTLGLLGLHELAIEKFQKANEIDPYDSDTYEAWGATLKVLGRFQEAAEVFKRASEYI